jgi:hypothetical protein
VRIRQVKPAFWADARMAELPESVRLFYIGLWMQADDAGWFRWDPIEVARDLYGYEGRAKRERRVPQMFQALVDAGRVVLHDCGHAEVPRMADHQRFASLDKRVRTVFVEHSRDCPQVPAGPREAPLVHGTERNGKGTVRNVEERNGSAPAGADLLSEREKRDRDELERRGVKLRGLGKTA